MIPRVCTIAVQRMAPIEVELDQDPVEVLEELHRPARRAARELIVLELYRLGEISSGKAAELLGMEREKFIRRASEQGVPYFQLRSDQLRWEINASTNSVHVEVETVPA